MIDSSFQSYHFSLKKLGRYRSSDGDLIIADILPNPQDISLPENLWHVCKLWDYKFNFLKICIYFKYLPGILGFWYLPDTDGYPNASRQRECLKNAFKTEN
jgi:hypothetical protein